MLDAVLAVCIKFEEIFRHEVTQREVKDPRRGVGSEYHRLQVRWMRIGNYPVLTKMMNMFRVIIRAKKKQKKKINVVSVLDITLDYSTNTFVATVLKNFTAAWLIHLLSRICAAGR